MQAVQSSSAHPTPLPNVIGSYHHAHGPFRSVRCTALDEYQPDQIALFQVETDSSYDIADYHILPIIGRRPPKQAWLADLRPNGRLNVNP